MHEPLASPRSGTVPQLRPPGPTPYQRSKQQSRGAVPEVPPPVAATDLIPYASPMTSPSMVCAWTIGSSRSTTRQVRCERRASGSVA